MSLEKLRAPEGSRQYCTFRLGHLTVGVDVHRVLEVIRHDRITPVPLASREVKGLINLRGQIITVLDLRGRLGLPDDGDLDTNVVVRSGDDAISLLVDALGDVSAPAAEDVEELPVSVPDRVRQLVTGAFKLEDRLLLVLDVDRVVASLDTIDATDPPAGAHRTHPGGA